MPSAIAEQSTKEGPPNSPTGIEFLFFMSNLRRFPENLVLQGLLVQHAIELPEVLLESCDLRGAEDVFTIDLNFLFPDLGHVQWLQ